MHFYTLRFTLCLIYIFLSQMNQCWPPLQVLCLWPQQNLGLGVGPKSYFHVDNLFLTLPLLNFIRYFSHFHSSLPHFIYIYLITIFVFYIFLPALCNTASWKSNVPNTQAGRNTVWEFILSFGYMPHSPNGVASCDPLLLVWALGAGYEAWVALSAPVIIVIAWIYDSMEISSSLAQLNAFANSNITVN